MHHSGCEADFRVLIRERPTLHSRLVPAPKSSLESVLVHSCNRIYAQLLSEFATIILPLRPSHVRTKPRPSPGAELLRLSRKR